MVIQMDNQNTGEFNTPEQPVSPPEPPETAEENNASSPRFVLNLSDEELDNADVFEEEITCRSTGGVQCCPEKKEKEKRGISQKSNFLYSVGDIPVHPICRADYACRQRHLCFQQNEYGCSD